MTNAQFFTAIDGPSNINNAAVSRGSTANFDYSRAQMQEVSSSSTSSSTLCGGKE